jgi:hypothetical protein
MSNQNEAPKRADPATMTQLAPAMNQDWVSWGIGPFGLLRATLGRHLVEWLGAAC